MIFLFLFFYSETSDFENLSVMLALQVFWSSRNYLVQYAQPVELLLESVTGYWQLLACRMVWSIRQIAWQRWSSYDVFTLLCVFNTWFYLLFIQYYQDPDVYWGAHRISTVIVFNWNIEYVRGRNVPDMVSSFNCSVVLVTNQIMCCIALG
jgi:hypothetical protein